MEDQPDGSRLFRDDRQFAVGNLVAEGRYPAHPHAFLFRGGDLDRCRCCKPVALPPTAVGGVGEDDFERNWVKLGLYRQLHWSWWNLPSPPN
jgi:hypothetical protein